MRWWFEESDKDDLELVIRKAVYDQEVEGLVHYLGQFSPSRPEVLPIKTEEKIEILGLEDLILVEVEGRALKLYTKKGMMTTVERLYKFQERLSHPDLVQVSRYALINYRHLDYLESAFSGNMTAFLKGGYKTSVSRRYLKELERKIGL